MSFKSNSCKKTTVGTSLENPVPDPNIENIVTRISRISTPRATLAAFALLVVVMTGFGVFIDGADGMAAEGARVANETVDQHGTESLQTCAMPDRVALVALARRTGGSHVHL